MRAVFYVASKDLKLELRRKYEIFTMIVFALISILIFNFGVEPFSRNALALIPGALWIILLFSGILGFSTSFIREMDQGTINGLRILPTSAPAILVGKIIYGFILIAIVEVAVVPLSMFLFNYTFPSDPLLTVGVFALGSLNLAVVGGIVSALTMYTESRAMLIPLVMFPLILPTIIPSVILTGGLMEGLTFDGAIPGLRILTLSLVAFLGVSLVVFEYVFKD